MDNGSPAARIVRIEDVGVVPQWLIQGLSDRNVTRRATAPSGPITIVDPESCRILDSSSDVPSYHTIMAITPDDEIRLGESAPGEFNSDNIAPSTTLCT